MPDFSGFLTVINGVDLNPRPNAVHVLGGKQVPYNKYAKEKASQGKGPTGGEDEDDEG